MSIIEVESVSGSIIVAESMDDYTPVDPRYTKENMLTKISEYLADIEEQARKSKSVNIPIYSELCFWSGWSIKHVDSLRKRFPELDEAFDIVFDAHLAGYERKLSVCNGNPNAIIHAIDREYTRRGQGTKADSMVVFVGIDNVRD